MKYQKYYQIPQKNLREKIAVDYSKEYRRLVLDIKNYVEHSKSIHKSDEKYSSHSEKLKSAINNKKGVAWSSVQPDTFLKQKPGEVNIIELKTEIELLKPLHKEIAVQFEETLDKHEDEDVPVIKAEIQVKIKELKANITSKESSDTIEDLVSVDLAQKELESLEKLTDSSQNVLELTYFKNLYGTDFQEKLNASGSVSSAPEESEAEVINE